MIRLYGLQKGYKGRGKYGGTTSICPLFIPMIALLMVSQGHSVDSSNSTGSMVGGWKVKYKTTETDAEGGDTATDTTYRELPADQIHRLYRHLGFELGAV